MEVPEFFQENYSSSSSSSQFVDNKQNAIVDHFIVEDLFDFSNEDDDVFVADKNFDSVDLTAKSTESSAVTVNDSCNSSSFSGCEPNFVTEANFSNDLCVPYDDLADLEWLSNFVEDSFSSDVVDLHKLQLITGVKARPDKSSETETANFINNSNIITNNYNNPIFNSDVSVPAKARSKRSRVAPGNWASRLLVLSPTTSSPETEAVMKLPPQHNLVKKTIKSVAPKRRDSAEGSGGDGRKCLHCATDKTPQWRTGPKGPKTLCNACGVRYKSGRLVDEYRPAASPTFVLAKHSNSHRKVLELIRQKQTRPHHHGHHQHQQAQFMHHHHHQNMVFDVSNGDDYLIHQHVGPDFRHLI
ncbi:hypothetical protein ACFE04_018096 [Oxalis oulophora]